MFIRLLLMFAWRNQSANRTATNLGADLRNLVSRSLLLLVLFLFDLHLNLSIKLFKDLLRVGPVHHREIFLKLVVFVALVNIKLLGWGLPAFVLKALSCLMHWQNWYLILVFLSSWRRRMLDNWWLFLTIVDSLCAHLKRNGCPCIHTFIIKF